MEIKLFGILERFVIEHEHDDDGDMFLRCIECGEELSYVEHGDQLSLMVTDACRHWLDEHDDKQPESGDGSEGDQDGEPGEGDQDGEAGEGDQDGETSEPGEGEPGGETGETGGPPGEGKGPYILHPDAWKVSGYTSRGARLLQQVMAAHPGTEIREIPAPHVQ